MRNWFSVDAESFSYLSLNYAVLIHHIQGHGDFIELLLGPCFVPGLEKKRWSGAGGGTLWDARFPCNWSLWPVPSGAAGAGKGEA